MRAAPRTPCPLATTKRQSDEPVNEGATSRRAVEEVRTETPRADAVHSPAGVPALVGRGVRRSGLARVPASTPLWCKGLRREPGGSPSGGDARPALQRVFSLDEASASPVRPDGRRRRVSRGRSDRKSSYTPHYRGRRPRHVPDAPDRRQATSVRTVWSPSGMATSASMRCAGTGRPKSQP